MSDARDRFGRFFAAVNDGATPYPWQCDLVERITAHGRWPSAIAMPTGAGKSSVVDVHVFAVAERARTRAGGAPPARPPRRLVLVAPRRALVEDQHERARHLARTLARSEDPVVVEIADALRTLQTSAEPDGSPLGVAQLRGGMRLELDWRLDPAQCQVICATPLMWGSRLLLRGFRGTRVSRNLEAGLLGHDVAVVIDEAHLHERLVETTACVAERANGPRGVQLVAMSATRDADGALRLGPEDLADPELRRRVRARKRISLVEVDDWRRDAVGTLVAQAQALATGDGTVGVFVNTVKAALDVAARLEGEVEVVCGRMRPADLDRLRKRRDGLLDARGCDAVDYLVTTQSLEVGVDLDLPAIVTEIAPAAALAQRAGRLNRSGRRDDAQFVVVAPRELASTAPEQLARLFAPYAGDEIAAAAAWIAELDGDASPERISATALPTVERLPLPQLTQVELATVALAGDALAADVDVEFYVEEPRDDVERTVSIGARRHLDHAPAVVERALLAAPPRAHELATIRLGALPDVLASAPGSWVMRSAQGRRTAQLLAEGVELRSGDVVVVPHGSPICTRGVIGGGKGRRTPIDDVRLERPDGVPPDLIVPLAARAVAPLLAEDATLGGRAARNALAELVADAGEADAAGRLRRHRRLSDLRVTWCAEEGEEIGLLVFVATAREGRLPAAPVSDAVGLDAHGRAVEQRLREVVAALDVDPVSDLGVASDRLLAAARWHDAGKRHPRFQRRMGATEGGELVAKPVPGHTPDQGDGWRHEQLSAAFAWAREDRDPVPMVLGAAHHGHGLPLFDRGVEEVLDGWDGCEADVLDALRELFGPYGRYELERERLARALGLHRLAHLEALLRCADMQVSREGG